jgi:acyl-[acyl-carrier-protein]-phospholipid O-acyltransferase/long-chain-fatty-acid--[acyl-carrier-protein] ligase
MKPLPRTPYDARAADRSLFAALLAGWRAQGGARPILTDGDERTLTYKEIVRAALALGHALKKGTEKGEAVGVLLPTGIGSVLTVFALSAYGRVPAMINFTAGLQSIHAALKAAGIKRIITAHRFIELGKLEALEAWLGPFAKIVYLEEVREKLSAADKAAAVVGSLLPGLVAVSAKASDTAVILFTSGTEGEPKGVALSHANILANVEQVRAHVPFFTTDIVFNPLPTFHSFGLTVGAMMPLFLGVKAVLHPTPRQPHEIVRRVKEHKATILLATDTFVSQYARVISVNQPGANHHGTVGRLMPQIETRIVPVEGISGGGRLYVKGPNVMRGYLRSDRPREIEPPPEYGRHRCPRQRGLPRDSRQVEALREDRGRDRIVNDRGELCLGPVAGPYARGDRDPRRTQRRANRSRYYLSGSQPQRIRRLGAEPRRRGTRCPAPRFASRGDSAARHRKNRLPVSDASRRGRLGGRCRGLLIPPYTNEKAVRHFT